MRNQLADQPVTEICELAYLVDVKKVIADLKSRL